MSRFAPQEIKPMLSLRGAPVGSEVTLTVVGLPPLARVRMGFGGFGGYESLGNSDADVYGVFTANLRVPYWGERDRVHFFFVTFGNQQPRAFSDPFLVTAPDGTVRLEGTIAAEATSCLAMDGPDDTRFALEGPLAGWAAGTKVLVVGTVTDDAACGGEGLPILVQEIHPA
jgi:hypothetical protein